MIGKKFSDGSILYNLRKGNSEALVVVRNGEISILKVSMNKVNMQSEKTACMVIAKISHDAICEIVKCLDPSLSYYDFAKSLAEKK